jgi:hypothetical protein
MRPVPPELARRGMRRIEDNREGRVVNAPVKAFMRTFGDLIEAKYLKQPEETSHGAQPAGPERP